MVCTRFNPSCNGPLHLGHLYTLLVNEQYAHNQGGRLVVRFDDSSPNYRVQFGDKLPRIREGQRADIEWLGIPVDEWQSQEELMPRVLAEWERHGHKARPYDMTPPLPLFVAHQRQETWLAYPYQPRLSFERVWFDHWAGVTHVIRGEDLATEHSLYCAACETFGLPIPAFVYLPRLESSRGDISKTAGGNTIAELRAKGWAARDVLDLVTTAALVNPADGWTWPNMRIQPRVAL